MTQGRQGLRLVVVLSCVAAGLGASMWVPPADAQWRLERGLVLVGTAVTMNAQDAVIPDARVFIRDGKILAVGRSGDALPAAASDALVVETDGVIYPGLIDLHNRPEWNVFSLWVVSSSWTGSTAIPIAI